MTGFWIQICSEPLDPDLNAGVSRHPPTEDSVGQFPGSIQLLSDVPLRLGLRVRQ